MEHAYAEALWKAVVRGMDPKKAVRALHDILVVRGRETLFPRIAKAFERIAQRSMVKEGISLYVARESDAHRARAEVKRALDETGLAGEKISEVKIDPTLIGGWRLEARERLVDASFKKQLLSIYNRTTHI
jgi:F0F1-type ATP synthase delta subunit